MNADEYLAHVKETALPSVNLDYLQLGLFGEIGEISSVVAKCIRDGGGDLDALEKKVPWTYREHLVDELGDVAWFVVMLDSYGSGLTTSDAAHYLLQPVSDFVDSRVLRQSKRTQRIINASTNAGLLLGFIYQLAEDVFGVIMVSGTSGNWDDPRGVSYREVYLKHFIRDMHVLALTIGSDMAHVLRHNVEKLASRKAHGTLEGSGDKR